MKGKKGTSPICQVGDCTKLATARGYCNTHYHRWRNYGDPLISRSLGRGTAPQLLPRQGGGLLVGEEVVDGGDSLNIGISYRIYNATMRQRRVDLGLTQRDLSARAGIQLQKAGRVEMFAAVPNEEEALALATVLGLSSAQVAPAWLPEALAQPKSGEVTYEVSTQDVISTEAEMNLDDPVIQESLKERMLAIVETLTLREKRVIVSRFGLDGDGPKALEDIALQFGCTRERIRQIEGKALRKLRHPSRSEQVSPFIRDSIPAKTVLKLAMPFWERRALEKRYYPYPVPAEEN